MTLPQPITQKRASVDVGLADCTVVIPTYNERENIAELIQRILEMSRFRVLVVDDNSPDGTAGIVADMAADEPRVGLLLRPEKRGLGSAYVAGFRRALAEGAAYICEMDADFSHDPAYLPQLLAAAETRYDLALGSRYVPGGGTTDWGIIRQMISRGGNLYADPGIAGHGCNRRFSLLSASGAGNHQS
jgi:dolichol-phosphate mannosyltransferase